MRIHHAALICSGYPRPPRGSTKLDLALPDGGKPELSCISDAPKRSNYLEAQRLRHFA